MLSGNVTPSDMPKYSDGRASGMAWFTTAGTAMYEALAASASYIAVPAALRFAIPEARPALYIGLSLGVTFPLNILLGIPFYAWLAARVL